jgi:hypothetical protein
MIKKKARESNSQFDSQPLKVRNGPDFLTCRWRVTYRWKALDKGYNCDLNLIIIRGLHTKLWALKVVGVSVVGISKLPRGPHPNGILSRDSQKYYKGEGGGFP